MVNFFWAIKTRYHSLFTKKLKVGFGPIDTGENDLSVRKWRIDPIIDEINRKSDKYTADFFISDEGMKKFDRIIIVKNFAESSLPLIKRLKRERRRFIYDIVDNPNCGKEFAYYLAVPEFIGLMDGFILSSPLHRRSLGEKPCALIEHPVINSSYKTEYKNGDEIVLLAQGYYENLKNLKVIEELLPEISQEIGKRVVLVYHSEVVLPNSEWTRYVKWTVDNCFPLMNGADIAITIKELHKLHQKTKPSTKVVAYMAAGLPVICFPTVADRLVVNHRVNGFFAFTKEDWRHWIQTLAQNVRLRKQIGRAARASVKDSYSIAEITNKYLSLLDQV